MSRSGKPIVDNRITIVARFVGGPWHNRVEEVGCAPKIIIRKPPALWSWSTGPAPQDHEYFLAEFQSEHFKTIYYQYIYKTLINEKCAHPCTYLEKFRAFTIRASELNQRLSEVLSKYRSN